jgi:hypothetical protein
LAVYFFIRDRLQRIEVFSIRKSSQARRRVPAACRATSCNAIFAPHPSGISCAASYGACAKALVRACGFSLPDFICRTNEPFARRANALQMRGSFFQKSSRPRHACEHPHTDGQGFLRIGRAAVTQWRLGRDAEGKSREEMADPLSNALKGRRTDFRSDTRSRWPPWHWCWKW